MVVCIRKNSELKKMCEEYIKNNTSKNNTSKNNNSKKINNCIVKINNLLNKLIKTRQGISGISTSYFSLGKIELDLNDFPADNEIKKLFDYNNKFIEPYCEFLTCLYFNQGIYFKFNLKKRTAFLENIKSIYNCVKEIIDILENEEFINLFLRIENSNVKRINNNNTNNNNTNNNNKNLRIFYNEIQKINEKYKILNNNETIKRKLNKNNKIEKYNDILINLNLIINYIHKGKNMVNPYNISDYMIFLLSISMFKSYNLLRIYYKKVDDTKKENIKKIITKNIDVIKEKYINNLFRFQFDYISKINLVKSEIFYYSFHNILIDNITLENKINTQKKKENEQKTIKKIEYLNAYVLRTIQERLHSRNIGMVYIKFIILFAIYLATVVPVLSIYGIIDKIYDTIKTKNENKKTIILSDFDFLMKIKQHEFNYLDDFFLDYYNVKFIKNNV